MCMCTTALVVLCMMSFDLSATVMPEPVALLAASMRQIAFRIILALFWVFVVGFILWLNIFDSIDRRREKADMERQRKKERRKYKKKGKKS